MYFIPSSFKPAEKLLPLLGYASVISPLEFLELLHCAGLYWTECSGFHWTLLDCTGLDFTGLCCAGLHFTRLKCTS